MEIKSLFDDTMQLAQKSLDLRSRRHELVLSNIANADTPNFKAFDLLVEEALAKQIPQADRLPLQQTAPTHMPAGGLASQTITPQMLEISPQVTLRGDGNTVDMDREMSSLAANRLQFKAASQILAKKFQSILNVIKEGSR